MITEDQKNKAIEILRQYREQQEQSGHIIRDSVENDCPDKAFTPGEPDGECEGDGHYMCMECIHFDKQSFIDRHK